MKISHKDTYGTIDDPNERDIVYCPYCKRHDMHIVLTERPNYNETDKELWRYCSNCTRVMHAGIGTKTSQLTGVVDPIDSPFDKANITGLGNKRKKNPRDKYREALLKKANKERDSEIRREILKGNVVDEGIKYE